MRLKMYVETEDAKDHCARKCNGMYARETRIDCLRLDRQQEDCLGCSIGSSAWGVLSCQVNDMLIVSEQQRLSLSARGSRR